MKSLYRQLKMPPEILHTSCRLDKKVYVPSLLAAIGGVIERHMIDTGFLQPGQSGELADPEAARQVMVVNDGVGGGLRQCPRCGDAALTFQEGCETCLSCGHSKCG